MDSRIEMRRKDFKKTFDDPRRRREEQQVQIRKQNREARISAKRQQALADLDSEDSSSLSTADIQSIPRIAQTLFSSNPDDQFKACQQFRKFLSIEKNPPIQAVLDADVVPKLIEFLKDHSRPDLQFEAAWALTNIASGNQEQTRAVIDNGALPIFVDLLKSPKFDIREQAVWALGNIAGDCTTLRDMVFSHGGLQPILEQLADALNDYPQKTSMLRNATWTLSNLCRAKPKPPLEWIAPALPILQQLTLCQDNHVLADACWAVSYITDGNEDSTGDAVELVLKAGFANRLVALLSHNRDTIQTPALRSVGNIVSGTEEQTEAMIKAGCIPALRNLLSSSRKHTRKEACWTLSNITAGSISQIEKVLQADIIPTLILMSGPTIELQIRREACWALANAASGASSNQVVYLVQAGIIPPLTDFLDDRTDLKLVAAVLEGIHNILAVGKKMQEEKNMNVNVYVTLFEEAQGFQKLEEIQSLPENSLIYQFAVKIIKDYLPYEEENEGDTLQYDDFELPSTPNAKNEFNFGGAMES